MGGAVTDQVVGEQPGPTAAGPRSGPAGAHAALRFAVMALLAVDGVLCAVATALLLPSYIGPVPFPVSALIGGLVNGALVWAALHWVESLRLAALPLYTWLLTVAAMTLGGPGDDLIFGGRGLAAYGVLVMIVLGAAPPAWLLWRRRRAAGPMRGSGDEA